MVGQTVSHYTILEKLGEGGMGVVYKAQDTKLNRFVALKFLPQHLSTSDEDKARFVQEAQAAAALNHPNICTIHGIDESGDQMFIVMEFVEGQTLRGTGLNIPLKQAIEIGIQLADGLATAHEKGIVHRDIKPENIMIQKDGRVRIMDFGLAKLKSASRLTKVGSTVGTTGYMSPEQVQGLESDHRSDIFSFGVILYELIAGQSPFKGAHETAINYEIVNVDPDPVSSIKPEIDPELDAIILDCMEKEVRDRCQSVAEVGRNLRRFKRESSRSRVSRVSRVQPIVRTSGVQSNVRESAYADAPATLLERISQRRWQLVSVTLFLISVLFGFLYFQSLSSPHAVIRASILSPEANEFNTEVGGHLTISPDGSMLAFVAIDSVGKNVLWVRSLNSLSALPLPGTGNATYPFWSPDGKSIAFFASGKLKRIDAAGGPVTTVTEAPNGRGGSWNREGVILLSPNSTAGLFQVPAAGGISTPVTKLDTVGKETSHRWPNFMPDGQHFVFTAQTGGGTDGFIIASSLKDTSRKKILSVNSNGQFVPGYLTYARQNNLIVHPYDPAKAEFTGDPVPIAERLVFGEARSRSIFSFSQNGILVYQTGATRSPEMFLVDRTGKSLQQIQSKVVNTGAQFSPDGKRMVLDSYDIPSANYDVWLYDIGRNINTRFTFNAKMDLIPSFSPDGSKVVFSSDRNGSIDLFIKDVNGIKQEEPLYSSPLEDYVTSWAPDGKSVLLSVRGDPKTKWDILLLQLTGEKKVTPLVQTEFNEWIGVFSPDGKWFAYQSDESGKDEIYVRTLDPRGGKWQVSSGGGQGPSWTKRSGEIVYTSLDKKIVASQVKYTASTFEVVKTTALFDVNIKGVGNCFDVSDDGQKFIIKLSGIGGETSPVTLVTNWMEDLKKK